MQVDVKLINPFIEASIGVMQMIAGTSLDIGKPSNKGHQFQNNAILIKVGIVGELNGYVILEINEESAKQIASTMMCGMPVETMDEMACSAISELGNMIMGNAATVFSVSDVLIDITPPAICKPQDISVDEESASIKVPLENNGTEYIVLNIIMSPNK